MSIIITHPSVLLLDNIEFKQLKRGVRGTSLFNLGDSVCAFSDKLLRWTGEADSSKVGLPITIKWGDGESQDITVIDGNTENVFVQTDGTFTFEYYLRRGVNKITVEIDNEISTNYLTAYDWVVFLTAWASEYTDFNEKYLQNKRDRILLSSSNELENITQDYRHLQRNFGAFTGQQKLPNFTVEQYSILLSTIFDGYIRGDMYSSLRNPIEYIIRSSIYIDPWNEKRFSNGDYAFKVRVSTPPGLELLVNGGVYNIENDTYTLRQSTINVPINEVTYLYCDTTKKVDGYAEIQTNTTRQRNVHNIAKVTTNGTNVTYIEGCQRAGVDNIGVSRWANANYLDVVLSTSVDEFELTSIGTIIEQNKPSDSIVFLYSIEDEIIGRY